MLNLIETINRESAMYLAITMLSLTILVHLLVIVKRLPFTWINGGRSVSYESQRTQSIVGIISLIIVIIFLFFVGNLVTVPHLVIKIILWLIVILLAISTVMQLLGTRFEKYVMSMIAFVLFICVLRMAL